MGEFKLRLLVNIFGRLDLESLLLDIPLVCKQWYQPLFNPFCWQKLVFPVKIFESRLADHAFECKGSFNVSVLIKFVVDRSNGNATKLVLPDGTTKEDLIYVSDVCPSLKSLSLPCELSVGSRSMSGYGDTVSELIVKWKSLEMIKLGNGSYLLQVIDKIALHCKNFVGLSVPHAYVDHKVASAIVSKLATIKYLALNNSVFEMECLEMILLGCKELEQLYDRNCEGFDEDDEEIIKLASLIKDFRCEGSIRMDVEEDHISHDELPMVIAIITCMFHSIDT